MNRGGENKGFQRAVAISVAAHIGLFAVILASPSLPKASKKGNIHYIPLNMVSLGGGGGPGGGGGGGSKAVVKTPAKKESLRDLTIPEKIAKDDAASKLRYPADKPKTAKKKPEKKAAVSKPEEKAAAETDAKNAAAEAGAEGGGGGSGIRFGTGGGGSGGGFGAGGDQLGLANFPFQWYLQYLQEKISSEWFKSLIDPGVSGQFQSVVTFRIQKDGRITDVVVEQSSSVPSLDDSARRAIMKASPFPPLPKEYEQDYLIIHLIFEHSK